MSYRTMTAALAVQSRTALLALLAAPAARLRSSAQSGLVDFDQSGLSDSGQSDTAVFTALAVASVVRFNARAYALADLALAGYLTTQRRRPVPVLGLGVPPSEPARLEKAVQTLLEREDSLPYPELQFGRLGYAEPLQAGRDAYSDGMAQHGVQRWTRVTDAGCCELCASLADGTELPVTQEMYAHTGCGCVAQPIGD